MFKEVTTDNKSWTGGGLESTPQELKSTGTRGVKKITGRVEPPNPPANRTLSEFRYNSTAKVTTLCVKKSKPLDGDYNFGNCGPLFKILSRIDS